MQNYKNLNGDSNVLSFEIAVDSIIVKFRNINNSGFNTYEYTKTSVGEFNLNKMKELANGGRGLNSFIKKYVNKKYQRRWKS